MSSLAPDVGRLEKSRQASFMLAGVVAAKTPESGQRTHDAVKKICESIMHAYEVANDSKANRAAKIKAIQAVADLTPELDWLLTFTKEEAEWCRFPEQRGEMHSIHTTLQGQVVFLKNAFRGLRNDVEKFGDVFDTLLALLEEATAFLRLGHASECRRVKDSLDNAYGESKNLAHCEVVSLLVDQAKLTSTRVNDAWKAIDSLVKIQPGLNDALVPRVDQVDTLLRKGLPELIMRTRDVVTRNAFKSEQQKAYSQLVACLDELGRILSQVSANYVNQFDESATRVPLEYDPLEAALKGVVKALADLKGAQMAHEPEMIEMQLAELIPEFVRVAVAELARLGATDQDKREFIDAVKKARDGDMNDFFAAQDKFNEIKERVKNRPPPVQIGLIEDNSVSKSKDLLAAAKDMCSAMAKLTIAMDD